MLAVIFAVVVVLTFALVVYHISTSGRRGRQWGRHYPSSPEPKQDVNLPPVVQLR
jgi:hypothetical protein